MIGGDIAPIDNNLQLFGKKDWGFKKKARRILPATIIKEKK